MSNLTQPAAVVHQPATQPNAIAPGATDVRLADDEVAAARLTAVRIRGQHAGLDGDEPAQ